MEHITDITLEGVGEATDLHLPFFWEAHIDHSKPLRKQIEAVAEMASAAHASRLFRCYYDRVARNSEKKEAFSDAIVVRHHIGTEPGYTSSFVSPNSYEWRSINSVIDDKRIITRKRLQQIISEMVIVDQDWYKEKQI